MKERHNSESTSDEIQSEKEVPSPPVVDDVISEDSSSSTLTRSDRTTLSNRVSLEDRHVLHRTTEYVTSNGHIEEPGPSPGPFNLSHDLEEMVTSDRSASADVSSLDEGTVPPSPEKKLSVEELAKDWLMIQIGHNCSNAVAEKFFHYAVVNCERIKELRDAGELNGLRSLRKKFNHDNVAGVKMDFKYQDKSLSLEERSLNEIDIFNVDAIPRLEYPSDKYNLIYQVAKIEVKLHYFNPKITFIILYFYIFN